MRHSLLFLLPFHRLLVRKSALSELVAELGRVLETKQLLELDCFAIRASSSLVFLWLMALLVPFLEPRTADVGVLRVSPKGSIYTSISI